MDELFNALWRASWQGAIAVVVVYSLLRLFPKTPPALTCWLWRLVGLKFLLTLALTPLPSLTLPLLPTTGAVIPAQIPETAPIAALVAANATPLQDAVVPVAPKSPSLLAQAAQGGDWRVGLLMIYFAGVAFALTRAIRAAFVALRLIREAVPADSNAVHAVAAELATRLPLRRVPRLARTTKSDSPLLAFGTILLPESATPDALRLMLAHELAHVQRRDLIWEWLGTLTQILFWFHPFVLWARREERLARESAADALALQIANAPAAEYGKLLLSLSVGPRRLPLLTGAVGAAETGNLLRRRLITLSAAPATLSRRRQGAFFSLMAGGVLVAFVPWRLASAKPQTTSPAEIAARPAPLQKGDRQLTMRLIGENGTPWAEAKIKLSRRKSEREYVYQDRGATVTNAQGVFSFRELPAGFYNIKADAAVPEKDGLVMDVALNGAKKAQSFIVRVPAATATLTGKITNRVTGKPLADVPASCLGNFETRPQGGVSLLINRTTKTDAQGRYKLPANPNTILVVGSESGVPLYEEQGTFLKIKQGATLTRNLALYPLASLRFTDTAGDPVAGVRVQLSDEGRTGYESLQETTDAQGIVLLRPFSRGTFYAYKGKRPERERQAWGEFWRDERTGQLIFRSETEQGTTTNYQATVILRDNLRQAALRGSLWDEGGKRVQNAELLLSATDTATQTERRYFDPMTRTESAMRRSAPFPGDTFFLQTLPGGAYRVRVRAKGYQESDLTPNAPFVPQPGEIRDLGRIILRKAVKEEKPDAPPAPAGTAQLSAVITESDGKPRAKAPVGLSQEVKVGQGFTMQEAGKTMTDAEGRFTFSDLKPGKYFVRVEAREGRTESGLSFNIALSASEKRNLALKIPLLAQVKGRLTYKANKMPAAGCRLLGYVRLTGKEAEDLNLSIQAHDDTDTEGRYVLPLTAGKAEVTLASFSGFDSEGKQIRVQEQKATLPLMTGQTGTQNFAVLPIAMMQFRDAQGKSLSG